MNIFSLILLVACIAGASAASDIPCGTDLKNLWLDVLVVVEKSVGMTQAKLTQARDSIIGAFQNGTRIGTTRSDKDPRITRIGFITYNSTATMAAKPDLCQSYSDLVHVANSVFTNPGSRNDSNMETALLMAEDQFAQGAKLQGRATFPKLLIVMSSSLTDETLDEAEEVASRMKADGVTIATVAYQHDEQFHRYMSLIASPGRNYTHNSDHVVEHLQHTATDANCICPPGYESLFPQRVNKLAQCVWSYDNSLNWANAKLKCQNDVKNGFLATEYSKEKHEFLDQFVRFRYNSRHDFFNGLHYVNGGWFWEQPEGMPLVKLSGFSKWSSGFPKASSTNVVVTNVKSETYETSWENTNTLYKDTHRFVCEVAACDTDHFCQ